MYDDSFDSLFTLADVKRVRVKEPIRADRIYYRRLFFFFISFYFLFLFHLLFGVPPLPLDFSLVLSPSLLPSFSIRTREGCLHAYKTVGARALEEKHGGRTCSKECLKWQWEEEKKKKARRRGDGERAGMAKTRPDGNDPKEFRGPPFLYSFLFAFSDSRFLLFPVLFRPTRRSPSLPFPRLIPLAISVDRPSFYPGPGTIANGLR